LLFFTILDCRSRVPTPIEVAVLCLLSSYGIPPPPTLLISIRPASFFPSRKPCKLRLWCPQFYPIPIIPMTYPPQCPAIEIIMSNSVHFPFHVSPPQSPPPPLPSASHLLLEHAWLRPPLMYLENLDIWSTKTPVSTPSRSFPVKPRPPVAALASPCFVGCLLLQRAPESTTGKSIPDCYVTPCIFPPKGDPFLSGFFHHLHFLGTHDLLSLSVGLLAPLATPAPPLSFPRDGLYDLLLSFLPASVCPPPVPLTPHSPCLGQVDSVSLCFNIPFKNPIHLLPSRFDATGILVKKAFLWFPNSPSYVPSSRVSLLLLIGSDRLGTFVILPLSPFLSPLLISCPVSIVVELASPKSSPSECLSVRT